jgi:hypothetical protein
MTPPDPVVLPPMRPSLIIIIRHLTPVRLDVSTDGVVP